MDTLDLINYDFDLIVYTTYRFPTKPYTSTMHYIIK